MTIQQLAKVIGALPCGNSTVHNALCAWLEPLEYPSQEEQAQAVIEADEILENIAKTVRVYAATTHS
jgi:hypothetical protein